MTVNRSDEGVEQLAGEYVLGTLPAAERRAVEARAVQEPVMREAIARWQARLLPLTHLAAPVAPPPALWQRIEATLSPAPARPAAAPRRRWWDSLALWRLLTGTGFACAGLLAALLLTRADPAAAPPQFMVVLVAPQDKAPGWVVQASSSRQVRLIPLAVASIPADKALQFWTKADGWNGPVSLGLVKPGEALQISLDKLPPLEANQLFELTLEPSAGSPIGRPTGPIQFIGRAVKVL